MQLRPYTSLSPTCPPSSFGVTIYFYPGSFIHMVMLPSRQRVPYWAGLQSATVTTVHHKTKPLYICPLVYSLHAVFSTILRYFCVSDKVFYGFSLCNLSDLYLKISRSLNKKQFKIFLLRAKLFLWRLEVLFMAQKLMSSVTTNVRRFGNHNTTKKLK